MSTQSPLSRRAFVIGTSLAAAGAAIAVSSRSLAGARFEPDDGIVTRMRKQASTAKITTQWRSADNQWWRSYGIELWEFDDRGLMRRREASINDVAILESDRKFFWDASSPRPADHPGISDVK